MKEIVQKFETQLSKHYLQTIKDLLEEQEINPQQFMQMAVNQIKRNNKLLQIFQTNPASVFSSILTCAEFGLSPTSQMGEAWLIPYGKECQFQIGYQGLTKILYKNPDVQNIMAECVYENDDFDYSLGLNPTLEHKPTTTNRGQLIAVYCVVRFANQTPIFKVMSVEELKAIQNLSKAGNRSIWFSPKDPQFWMLKKTVFKQLCKLLPKNLNMSKVVSYDNIVEGGGTMRLDDENNPIVIEGIKLTRADKFKAAMEEDIENEERVDHIAKIKEIDPTINIGKVNIVELKEKEDE
jgi:recombination protein RecT|tara:strand:+ start:801 stop:1682 length:882 start_codon:yes stop_codon:yes gene_type:complete